MALCCFLTGCAALTNPVADGVPVRYLTPDFLGASKEGTRVVPLSLLRQKPPEVYRLAPGDILGVWIEGILGEPNQPPPLRLPERGDLPPAMGYPMPVRSDGTMALPLVPPLKVEGLSVEEVQDAIRKAYTTPKRILKADEARIIVTLMRRRQYHVLVFRQNPTGDLSLAHQDTGAFSFGPEGITQGTNQLIGTRRGSGFAVDLPAYENDVLNALAQTGGLPGHDSANEIIIQRGYFKEAVDRDALLQEMELLRLDCKGIDSTAKNSKIIRIPLRLQPGEELALKPEDILLETGDIIYLPERKPEVFFAGGLLPSGEYPLPYERDLTVVEAVARIRGPLINGGLNTSNLSGSLIAPGIGGPSPSLLTVLRRVPGTDRQLAIRVDLNKALRDPRERLLVQPGDMLILQETPGEGIARYVTQMFKFNIVWQAIHGPHENGTVNATVP
jgi:hypothetical protein